MSKINSAVEKKIKDTIRKVIQHVPNAFNSSDEIVIYKKLRKQYSWVFIPPYVCLAANKFSLNFI